MSLHSGLSSEAVSVFIFAQLVIALLMTGVIWCVQLILYPQFDDVGESAFATYHQRYMRRISWIVVPLMLLELALATLSLVWFTGALRPLAAIGLSFVVAAWACTGCVQVPLHQRLSRSYTLDTQKLLVLSNWIRTVLWTGRSAFLAWWCSLGPIAT